VAASLQSAEGSGSTAISGRAQPQTPRPPQHGFGRLWRALKQLFHEAVAAVFAVLALAWLNAILRSWTRDVARWMIVVGAAVVALFIFFAVTSFRRARKL
jgi:hypothetical protein